MPGPAGGELPAQLGPAARLLAQQPQSFGDQLGQVEAGQPGPERAAGRERAFVHPAQQRCEHDRVPRADQVHGRTHQADTHGLAAGDQACEFGVPERAEPAPQPDVQCQGRLRLHADQVLDRVNGRQIRAAQQQLPGEGGPVQCPAADRVRHAEPD